MNPFYHPVSFSDMQALSSSTTLNTAWPRTASRDIFQADSSINTSRQPNSSNDSDLIRSISQVLTHGPPVEKSVSASASLQLVDALRQCSLATQQPQTAVELNEEQLLKLYSKSEALLPNGSRVRNILWRMNSRRRIDLEKVQFNAAHNANDAMINWSNASHGAYREPVQCQKPLSSNSAFEMELLPSAGQNAGTGSYGYMSLSTPQTAPLPPAGLDRQRRRSSSHTIVGAEPAQQQQQNTHSLGNAATLQPHQEEESHYVPPHGLDRSTEMDDLELARPLELWNMALDPSLLWLTGNSSAWPQLSNNGTEKQPHGQSGAAAATQQNANEIAQLPFLAGPAAHHNQQQQSQHVVVHDTQLIDARVSAGAFDSLNRSSAGSTSAANNQTGASALDLDLFLSPNSLLPHWPHESQATAEPSRLPAAGSTAKDGSKGKFTWSMHLNKFL
ncbi:hypothetical protein IWW36_002415 [Coemansia brasiliensis]|uniref:Uncharacterized protein n=1 Tax=Coemansia brasiliensis TaxID=2650707 RepID=A0A9W8IDH2_9FUNG|nr:hypothetical protein IWW36_002415 [Coemansia brasiliensis]